MKEFVLVEFIAIYSDDSDILLKKLDELGKEFVMISEIDNFTEDEYGNRKEWIKATGMISSEYASLIKLTDSFLAERMRISYIEESLKDKYRK